MQDVTAQGYIPSSFLHPSETLWATRTPALFQYSDLRIPAIRELQVSMHVWNES